MHPLKHFTRRLTAAALACAVGASSKS